MTPKERTLRAINHRKPDRIPLFDEYWDEFKIKSREELGLGEDTEVEDYYGLDMRIGFVDEAPIPSLSETLSETSDYRVIKDGWGRVNRVKKGGYFYEQIDSLIKTPKDLDTAEFDPPTLDSRFNGLSSGKEGGYNAALDFDRNIRIEARKGRAVYGKIGGLYIRSMFLRGEADFLMDMVAEPDFIRALVEKMAEFLLELGKQILKRGKLHDTGIWIYDDMGSNKGPMFSPQTFEHILLPSYVRVIDGLKEAGASKVGLHSDGNILPVLDMFVDAGIGILNPVEPRAGMLVPELKKKYGTRLAFVGGMCNSDVLINGPKERIVRRTEELIDAGRDGGLVIGSHSIGSDISVENYLTFIDTIRTKGRYT